MSSNVRSPAEGTRIDVDDTVPRRKTPGVVFIFTRSRPMTLSLAEQMRSARVYDLEQPRFAGMPIHPTHQPGYFYALHRRHRDNYRPEAEGPRSGASGVLTMMEHSGTHIDALCHQACDLTLYGGV